ncbi:unnamed protein product [Spirodela intermedia]|uniref:DNL-type domain-containing protein n=1 Tax=Spirodela intermedia TaxID=51605 RepID=A0A7I8J4N0_SPIIN|nr:unnamed protein product [Spirodela intermedia]CAA6665186.1 unnamed protein product [Spirodela intermedia]
MASGGGSLHRSLFAAAAPSLRMLRARLSYRGAQSLEQVSAEPDGGLSWLFRMLTATRGIQTNAESSSVGEEDPAKPKPQFSSSNSAEMSLQPYPDGGEPTGMKYSAISSLKTSSRHDFAMIFTCKVCETRSVKTACRESYEKGIVVARCEGCNNLHLIADRLGWFGTPGSVEEFLAARGEEVKKGSVDTLSLTLEDLAGAKSS